VFFLKAFRLQIESPALAPELSGVVGGAFCYQPNVRADRFEISLPHRNTGILVLEMFFYQSVLEVVIFNKNYPL
jgi:hypothetical protein